MKNYKYIIGILVWLLMGLPVNAAVGTVGICYGKELVPGDAANMGYCYLYPDKTTGLSIGNANFTNQSLKFTEGKGSASAIKYTTTYDGAHKDLFCLDPNFAGPSHNYTMARPFKIGDGTGSSYDVRIAKAYALYIEKSVEVSDFEKYYQTANVVMRAITIDPDLTPSGGFGRYGGTWDYKLDYFYNIVKQFRNGTVSGVKLDESPAEYAIARQWFCSATGYNCSGVTNTDVELKTFEVKMEGKNDDVKTENVGDSFTKTMPVVVSKLAEFTEDDRYNKAIGSFPAPYVEITEVECNNDKVTTCILTDEAGNDLKENKTNLLSLAGGSDTLNIKLVVGGKTADFKSNADIKVSVAYKYYHILDTSRLAALRFSIGAQTEQRLIMVSSNSATHADITPGITIKIPSVCKYDPEEGTYSIGVEPVAGAKEYMEHGCCDVDINVLTEDELEYYKENCATEDTIELCPDCQEGGFLGCDSRVFQQPLSKIMASIKKQDDALDKPHIDKPGVNEETQYFKNLDAYKNNRDDVYLLSYIEPDNKYCRLYTSEDTTISYPGSLTTNSGRYFTFKENEQPSVKSIIDADFHINVDHWKNDYTKAIEDEKAAYTAWQEAEAAKEARDDTEPCTTKTCTKSCAPPPGCTTSYTGYEGTNTGYATDNKWYRADGSPINGVTATQSCSCSSGTRLAAVDVATPKAAYEAAVTYRQSLEKMKQDCETASKIKENWEYLHAPDMTFYYDQDYQDPISGKIRTEVLEYPMVISIKDKVEATEYHTKEEEIARIEKFWPNWTEDPVLNEEKVKGTESIDSSTFKEKYGAYKAGKSCPTVNGKNACDIDMPYDKETDYTVGYEHTIYYRSDISFFSLIPSGKTVPLDSYSSTDKSYLDIGYVFTVNVTTYGGIYNWWFEINNIGHYKADEKDSKPLTGSKPGYPEFDIIQRSNIQHSVDNHWVDHPEDVVQDFTDLNHLINGEAELITHTCVWPDYNQFIEPPAECIPSDVTGRINPDECPPDEGWSSNVFYRTIATGDINPLGRELGENWSDTNDKGRSAREKIEDLGNEIYNDAADWLEYSITINPNTMNDVQEYNSLHSYYEALTCNEDGKECLSSFLDWLNSLGTDVVRDMSGREKWKYYIEETGLWENDYRSFFDDGRYPEETAGLTYWP